MQQHVRHHACNEECWRVIFKGVALGGEDDASVDKMNEREEAQGFMRMVAVVVLREEARHTCGPLAASCGRGAAGVV